MTESLKDFCDFVTAQLPGGVPTVLLPHPNYERFAPQEGSRLPDALSNGVVGSASSFTSAHRTARSRTDEASVADLRRDPSFAACWGPALNDGAQAAWSVPILSKGREILGTLIFFYPTAQHPTERHVTVMQRAVEMAALVIEGRRHTDGADDSSRAPAEKRRRPCLGGLIGESRSMHQVYDLIQKVSEHDYPVLILGESGTGKELVAKSAHLSGLRSNKPFIPIDCSSLVPTLAETELFGYAVSGHPLELFEDVAWETYCPVARLGEHVGETVVTCGLVVEQRTHRQITGEPMKFLTLADWTGMVETELFAQTYKSYGLATVRYPVLEVEAKVEAFQNGRGFTLRVLRAGKPRVQNDLKPQRSPS